jgi:CubicO group peptidase (beta-lactamase class C family)
MLVEEGNLSWDKPVRDFVPEIRFFNDQLTNSVTLRDMLSAADWPTALFIR